MYICQENNYKDGIDMNQKYQEQEVKELTTSTTNAYTQQYITSLGRGTRLTQQKETTQKREKKERKYIYSQEQVNGTQQQIMGIMKVEE